MNRTVRLALALVTLTATGCAASLVYDTGRSWKQQECYKIPEQYERQRCLQSTAMTYEEYRRTLAREQTQ
jgi:hypothetical protein